MSLSIIAVRELQRELAHLEEMRVNVDTRIGAIHALISDKKAEPSANGSGSASRVTRGVSSPKTDGGSLRKLPFHTMVLRTVTGANGLKPRQVTDVLLKSGYTARGKKGLGAKVYNAMYDMFRKGVLKKTDTGVYFVAESSSPENQTAKSESLN